MKNIKRKLFSVTLMAGISAVPFLQKQVNDAAYIFASEKVVVQSETLSMQEFYNRVHLADGKWAYEDKNGKVISLDELTDFRVKDDVRQKSLEAKKFEDVVDTVKVRYAHNQWHASPKKQILFSMGAQDSLVNLPSLGLYVYGGIKVREFVASNDSLQRFIDIFNDKYNCTKEHELQHYANDFSGISKAGQSYENKFVECCMDEVSANIAQLIAQRKNYLKNGKDVSFISSSFAFYANAIKKGDLNIESDKIEPKEAEFIANGVLDSWLKLKYDMYESRNFKRVLHILGKTNYNGVQPSEERHDELIKKMFFIKGMDFSFIKSREGELRGKMSDKVKADLLSFKKLKFMSMRHLDKLEQTKIEKGPEAYNAEVSKKKASSWFFKTFASRR